MNTTLTTKQTLSKQKSHAFGKDVYLLGTDSDGIMYWLEAPKWDCGWYWGFGYVETYKNNRRPNMASDIDSHTHIDSSFMGKQERYDYEVKGWKLSEYVHNIYDHPTFANTTFTEKEGWALSELFKTFYSLRQSAEIFGRGGAHLSTNPCSEMIKDEEMTKKINEVMIPAITAKIIEILSPLK